MYNTELYHHGILGQKWGVRRYQNEDGTLTSEGKNRYGDSSTKTKKAQQKKINRIKNNVKTIAKRTIQTVAVSAIMTMAVNEVLSSNDGQTTISTGQSVVNSYIKQNPTRKINENDTKKGWADYAWEEVQKSGWG